MHTILRYILFCLLILSAGCTPTVQQQQSTTGSDTPPPLRIGIAANAPPFAFSSGKQLQGLEVDLARQLGEFLNKDIAFVELTWAQLIPALEEGRIDIIMSGMTITPKREYRVLFAKPYMRSGQMLLVRSNETFKYSSGIYSLMGSNPAIGTIEGTTGDLFITKTINQADLTRFRTSKEAVGALIDGNIDVLVHDAPIVCHYAAINENNYLTPIMRMETEEYLAWAVSKRDVNLRDKLNQFITVSAQNEQLQETITRWIPYL